MFVILPLILLSFNRPILFIFKGSPHAATYMPYCIFSFSFSLFGPLNVCFSANHSSKFQPADIFYIQMTFLCFIAFFSTSFSLFWPVEYLLFCHSFSEFQPTDTFYIQMNPSSCHFYALLYIFLLLSLCFDMLNNFYSAAHSWKFRPADSFHNQMKPSCCHLYASCILLYFFPLFWPVEYLLFCHSFSKFQLADTFLIQMKHSYCNFYASLLSFVFLSLF